jgi:8-oxo-dGTP pyrophosphatase MutT (NUDIX family)
MPHIHKEIDFAADVLIVYKNRTLLRKHDKLRRWLCVGGHIELYEDPNQAAIREVKEEVGLDITLYDTRTCKIIDGSQELIAPQFVNRHRINETHEHVTSYYFAATVSDQFTNQESECSEEIRWFTKEELDDPQFGIDARIVFYAKAALEVLGEK